MNDKSIKILEKTKNSIEVELIDDDHSLCNLLKDILLEKKDKVIMASYVIEHPVLNPKTGRYISNPKLTVKTTDGNDAEEVLKESLKEVIDLCNKTLESLNQ
ncbi:DNA-directed RNA polymerase subunit L [Methanothermococcus okinawensis]|uniref:DNA-directed RNA polymerase subunit Rpo11 n=1 Tax=Methanothermococcus okinawensis (strain DSM 14208 / JCM 11175 / IH1) TaxID=647113 RepID=F8AMH7_METOI|nr:DNA-directed RNA polymerase subunit L [Methanothermococcus okinawensis]AEH06017.1 DNA-directed RNA polymerase subunit L [Methanothermococcus okinawensis IH1]